MNPVCFRALRPFLAFLFLLLLLSPAHAHNSSKGISALRIIQTTNGIEAQLALSFFEIESISVFDKNKDGTVTPEEMTATTEVLKSTVAKEIEVYCDGKHLEPGETKGVVMENTYEVHLIFPGAYFAHLKVRCPIIRRFLPDHQEFFTVLDEEGTQLHDEMLTQADIEGEFTRPGATAFAGTSTAAPTTATAAATTSDNSSKPSAAATFFQIVKKGVEHILTGYDHLLFLFALLVVCETFWSVAKIITCFTIAHSLTLALAAFNIVPVNSRIVEPLIAATIVFVGVENLLKLKTIQWRWVVTFVFGLIHGFGFASGLRELGLGTHNILLPVLSFNLGVELGQIAVALLVLPLLWQLKKMPQFAPRWIPATSLIVVTLGGYWLYQRLPALWN